MTEVCTISCESWKDKKLKQFCLTNNLKLEWIGYSVIPISYVGPLRTTWKILKKDRDVIERFIGTL